MFLTTWWVKHGRTSACCNNKYEVFVKMISVDHPTKTMKPHKRSWRNPCLAIFGKGDSKGLMGGNFTLDRRQKSIKFPHTCTIFHALFMFDNYRNHLTCLKMGLDIWHFVSTIFWKKPMFWTYPQSWFSGDFCPSKTIFQAPTHWTLIYLAILYWIFKFTLPETHRKSQHLENSANPEIPKLLETIHFLRANLLFVLGIFNPYVSKPEFTINRQGTRPPSNFHRRWHWPLKIAPLKYAARGWFCFL